jgi:exopolyphosphatase/guanosine-5'-triphosphate,3'-diphosphate pyrophosphatase
VTSTAGRQQVVAGVDLGSNSFHLVLARSEEDGRIHVLDKLRDPVRLAAGLDSEDCIGEAAIRRGMKALERFGERLRTMPSSSVRAVATNTLRRARNGGAVEEMFSEALGHPLEIISGPEEARLIYQGVTHVTPQADGRQLVIDIGGGSTECIVGSGFEALALDSLYMGCVGYTRRHFGNGHLTRDAFNDAKLAAGLELSSIAAHYLEIGWDRVIGTSGTILAVSEVLRSAGWTDGTVTSEGLALLEEAIISRKRADDLELPGLEADRAPVFPGGVAILSAVFHFLGIESLVTSPGALREGLVYELLGRVTEGDPRDRTIETFATRYKVDRRHARRVEETVLAFFEQANESWGYEAEEAWRLLRWAARVHEIGLSIAYSGYHKHGAYILEHADMPGFSIDEQTLLATLVGGHRRKLSRDAVLDLPSGRRKLALRLIALLRLAIRLHHSRSDEALPELRLEARKSRFKLTFPKRWLRDRPLTRADLEEEIEALSRAEFVLEVEEA